MMEKPSDFFNFLKKKGVLEKSISSETEESIVLNESVDTAILDGADIENNNAEAEGNHLFEKDLPEIGETSNKAGAKKRKRLSVVERKERDISNHKLLPPCLCKRKCIENICEERRKDINNQFWKLDYNKRRMWIKNNVKLIPTKRPRLDSRGDVTRNTSRLYFMMDEEDVDHQVCKVFFLRTLGYTSDKIITVTLQSCDQGSIMPANDRRGKHEPANKLSDESHQLIVGHIKSFNPSVSHYRREHAPNRLYLSPELSIKSLYDDFKVKHKELKLSYDRYRKEVNSLNISFVKLGEEECEDCILYEKHSHDENSDNITCEMCTKWKSHIESARISRKYYKEDAQLEHDPSKILFSVDMQKVIMLPRMPGVKTAVFTKRLVAFHETFAPLGSFSKAKGVMPTGVIWHEGISGRNAEDVASTYVKIICSPKYRDIEEFIFWCDNCSGQNKNWTLFTAFCYLLNVDGCPETITLKYFEKGHTFMSADSFHHQIEKEMRAKKNVYDFNDFEHIIASKGYMLLMSEGDFLDWENGVSQGKFADNKPLLANVQVLQFRKNETKMFWKESHEESEFKSAEFLKKKISSKILKGQFPRTLQEPRGITSSKKNGIVVKLAPLMPPNRREFWCSLYVNDESNDLIDNFC